MYSCQSRSVPSYNIDFVSGCNHEVYDSDTHMCCMDELHEKPLGAVEVECCFKGIIYNPLTHYCCVDVLFGGVRRAVLAPKEPGITGGRSCFRALNRPQNTD